LLRASGQSSICRLADYPLSRSKRRGRPLLLAMEHLRSRRWSPPDRGEVAWEEHESKNCANRSTATQHSFPHAIPSRMPALQPSVVAWSLSPPFCHPVCSAGWLSAAGGDPRVTVRKYSWLREARVVKKSVKLFGPPPVDCGRAQQIPSSPTGSKRTWNARRRARKSAKRP
jgi:hypothetical protein